MPWSHTLSQILANKLEHLSQTLFAFYGLTLYLNCWLISWSICPMYYSHLMVSHTLSLLWGNKLACFSLSYSRLYVLSATRTHQLIRLFPLLANKLECLSLAYLTTFIFIFLGKTQSYPRSASLSFFPSANKLVCFALSKFTSTFSICKQAPSFLMALVSFNL